MGEEKINKIKVEDLPKPEQELTPEESKQITGGQLESQQKLSVNSQEHEIKSSSAAESSQKTS
ncbi:MAG TPA: hypothetical protein VE821_12035 [Pyrinomonadaceae bacterium]|nr:hypothetical protein [Pyrinomonadaceae bacterium]